MNIETEYPSDLELMFTVSEAYTITGRGLVVVSAQKYLWAFVPKSVVLKTPNGTILKSAAFPEFLCPNPSGVLAVGLPDLSKDQVPPGTEVWGSRTGTVRTVLD